ncbi:MAG: helix-turn-helix domain-containing protein [Planctomycetota bacterium]
MGTQRKRKNSLCEVGGTYRRTLGKFINTKGKIAPKKFMLGRDRRKAEAANARLELLWDVVEEHHATRAAARPAYLEPAQHDTPLWAGTELEIAEAVRLGQQVIQVGIENENTHTAAGYASRLHWLNQTYGHVIRFVPALPDEMEAGQQRHQQVAAHRIQQATHNAAIAKAPIPTPANTTTLYEAIDAYADHAERQASTPRMKEKARDEAQRMKQATPDMPLELFGFDAIQRIGDHWRSRPNSRRKGKGAGPIAIATVTNQCKAAKRFVRWMDRSDTFDWERPRDFEFALVVNEKRLRTEDERAALAQGPKVWTDDELIALYRNATDRERALILMGLNFGFAQAEIITLRTREIVTTGPAPILKRLRHKTEVYVEIEVWPETMQAIAWLEAEHKRHGHDADGLVWITEKGKRPTGQHIANAWAKLMKRTQQNNPDFAATYSFKHLRKTAGQLVREVSDGETAGVFLAHGQPVSSDGLLDAYTRRVFERVFQANAAVRERLAVMFAAAPDAFAAPRTGGSPNIPRATIDKIKRLWGEGVKATEIARIADVSRQTVYRYRPMQDAEAA